MMTAWFVSGASLFALLIVDICCLPIKDNNPGASYGGSYSNTAPNFGSDQGASSIQFMPNKAPQDASTPSYQPMPDMSRSQPAVRRQPASPVGFRQPGTTFQPTREDVTWALPPPSPFSSGEEMLTGTSGIGSLTPDNVSPPLPPAGPMYQAGDLSHYEQNLEYGNYEGETEDQGYLAPPPPPPMQESYAGPEFTSQPQPESGSWGIYPYYDYMFVTGQYPPGTYTHSSVDYEQGSDNWQEDHYERYYYPLNNPGPAEQTGSLTFEALRQPVTTPVKAGYGPGGTQPQLLPYGFRKI